MTDGAIRIILLAGRLIDADERARLRALVDALAGQKVDAQIMCAGGANAVGRGAIEAAGLASRWRRSWDARRLRPHSEASPPSLLHVLDVEMAIPGLILAETWSLPYVLSVAEFLTAGWKLRLSRSWCRGLIASSRDLAADLARSMRVPDDFIDVVPTGFVTPESGPCDRDHDRVPVIGAAGPLSAGSGLPTFLNAARRVLDSGIDAEFVVAGVGRDETDLRRRADRLRIADRVTFAGPPNREGAFWKVVDLFCKTAIVPSVGRTMLEAMAFGVPTIASDVAGLRACIRNGETGLLVPPGDADALALSILSLLADPNKARSLGERGRESVLHRFDIEREAIALAALYRRIASGDGHPSAQVATGSRAPFSAEVGGPRRSASAEWIASRRS